MLSRERLPGCDGLHNTQDSALSDSHGHITSHGPSFLPSRPMSFSCIMPSKHLLEFSGFLTSFQHSPSFLKIQLCSSNDMQGQLSLIHWLLFTIWNGNWKGRTGSTFPLNLSITAFIWHVFKQPANSEKHNVSLPLAYTSQYVPLRTLDLEVKVICMTTDSIMIQVQQQVIRNGEGGEQGDSGGHGSWNVQPSTCTLPC